MKLYGIVRGAFFRWVQGVDGPESGANRFRVLFLMAGVTLSVGVMASQRPPVFREHDYGLRDLTPADRPQTLVRPEVVLPEPAGITEGEDGQPPVVGVVRRLVEVSDDRPSPGSFQSKGAARVRLHLDNVFLEPGTSKLRGISRPPSAVAMSIRPSARLLQGVQNPDTALFGFSSAQAVEVVVRVQDTRPFAPRFDIYYGGMTDVGYTVTVTDTQTGTTRQYVNTVGKVGGGVDRSSFPAN